jgi:hypothetical protein
MRKPGFSATAVVGAVAALLVLFGTASVVNAQVHAFNPVGTWYGNAKPPEPVPPGIIPEIVMIPTFMEDGNVIANDSQELNGVHGTAHGRWIRTGPYSFKATFIWLQLAAVPNGFGGVIKVRMVAGVLPPNMTSMVGSLSPVLFPPGTDPLDPADKGGIPLGTFYIDKLRRLTVE